MNLKLYHQACRFHTYSHPSHCQLPLDCGILSVKLAPRSLPTPDGLNAPCKVNSIPPVMLVFATVSRLRYSMAALLVDFAAATFPPVVVA